MKSYYIHLKNKFPTAKVSMQENAVYANDSESGELLCIVVKNGLGQWIDGQADHGAKFAWDLSPIPKDARVFKQCPKTLGIICDELADDRRIKAKEYVKAFGKVPSIIELEESKKAEKSAE